MWTPETRAEHDRDELRYPSDLTNAEWQILAPLLPPPAETGRHRSWPMREMMNAIFFVLRGGCPWRIAAGALPTAPDGLSLVHSVSRRPNLGTAQPPARDARSRACRP
jgi:hypothetical protein